MYKRILLVLHLAVVLASAQFDDAGNAVSFDGTTADYIFMSPFNNFPSNAITVEFWMRTSDTTKAGTPFSYATSTEDNMLFIHDYRDLRFRIADTAIPASGGTGISLNNNLWHHVAVMWRNNGLFIVYIDGVQRYSQTGVRSGYLIPSGGSLVIGQEQDTRLGGFQASEAFLGTIDEMRIWGIQRSEPQIRANMHRSLSGDEAGLVAYYRFDESSGDIAVYDWADFDQPGQLTGATRVASTAPVGLPVSVNTSNATAVTTSSATLNGSVDPNGLASVGFFEYGTSPSALSIRTPRVNIASTANATPISRTVSGLQPSATYYFRAVGSNVLGEVAGPTGSFSTLGPPTVSARPATQVTTDRAVLWATFNGRGSPMSIYFEYGANTNYGLRTEASNPFNYGFSDVGLGQYVSNLLAETTYHYRGVASNAYGVTYGPDGSFVTQIFGEAASFPFNYHYTDAAWGDYDNDQDLDLLMTGTRDGDVSSPCLILGRNNGGVFSYTIGGLPAVGAGLARWGDFDGDGWLDLFVMGNTNGFRRSSEILRNNRDGTFSNINAPLPGLSLGAAAWADYDRDGDLDLFMTGTTNGQPNGNLSQLLRNNGDGTFAIGGFLAALSRGAVAWGDYDNDGDLDIVIAGQGSDGNPYTWFYRNQTNTFEFAFIFVTAVRDASLAWGDYDNDGDPDLLLTGTTSASGSVLNGITQIWRNDGNEVFTLANSLLPGVSGGMAAWGDFDNDGDLDIALTGMQTNSVPLTQLYSNEGNGTFASLNVSLPGLQRASLAWADYDNDGDLDLALVGTNQSGGIGHVRRNDSFPANTVPDAPSHLAASVNLATVTLSWSPANDDHTPAAGLTYNIHVTPNVSASQADLATGYRRVPALGNVQQGTNATLILSNYPAGTYYWTVQAIDSAFAGGPFAPTNIIELAGRPSITPMSPINLTPNSATLQALVNPGGRNTSASFDFGPTTAYGTQLGATNIGNGFLDVLVTADVDALAADRVYHYRATAFNVFGPGTGADVAFRTAFFSHRPHEIEVALPPGASTNVLIALSNHITSAVSITNRFVAPLPAYAAVVNPTLTLAGYGTASVNVLIDATALTPDTYQATLEIVSGSTHAIVQVPVQLTVIAAEPAEITSVSLQPNGSMILEFAGTSGYAQTVFASTNLQDWTALGSATQISLGRFQFTDPSATNFNQRFYKIRTP